MTARWQHGALITELMIAMSILVFVLIPLSFAFLEEQKLARAYYNQAIAMEIVDGEMEVLAAGEWRVFKPGSQDYQVRAEAAKNLPPGRFVLTIQEPRVKLEWRPEQEGKGGAVRREVTVK